MSDEKTLRLAFRPITPDLLAGYIALVQHELAGATPVDALKASGLAAEDGARVGSVVAAFCRPRLLRRRLARAKAKDAERAAKQAEVMAAPIDDRDLIAMYGEETHRTLMAQEAALVDLRARVAGEG